ncbi:DUF3017 domain-containing protein [Auraticoccus sp. F435]|uniref:DUF3017 domain-containing protein n=1 Tax=Auraticoccus cholistanensis TaxID=2656650 RepID=A0A6A9UXK8_9ACTN|nr:DUF3017 domain-containing protein [Auraticoccus cholistanensis]MVA76392.1 DUF3017 domain-containing protein [Auraticoccus cholistanensis]
MAVLPPEPTGAPATAGVPPRRGARTPRSLGLAPLAAALGVFVVGLVLVGLGWWRGGLWTCAGGLLLGALLRLVLPSRSAGLLRVRHRAVDVLLLGAGGLAVAVLAYLR